MRTLITTVEDVMSARTRSLALVVPSRMALVDEAETRVPIKHRFRKPVVHCWLPKSGQPRKSKNTDRFSDYQANSRTEKHPPCVSFERDLPEGNTGVGECEERHNRKSHPPVQRMLEPFNWRDRLAICKPECIQRNRGVRSFRSLMG